VPLASNALTTFSAVKGLVSNVQDTDQAAVERLINIYSQTIESYCNRRFAKTVATNERYARPVTRQLVLKRRPLISIEAISVGTSTLEATNYYIEDADAGVVRLKTEPGSVNLLAVGSAALDTVPGSGELDVLVSYTAGYVLPKDEAAGPPAVVRTLPYDLEDVAIQCVASAWHRRGVDVAGGGFDGANEAIGRALGGMIPGPLLPTLKRYQRWV
jgi:hypothetical protein